MVARGGLILVTFALARTRRSHIAPAAVGAYMGGGGIFNDESQGATISYSPNWKGAIINNEPDNIFNE